MASHSSTAITMVNQPVLSHERDFSLGRKSNSKDDRGEVVWIMDTLSVLSVPQGPPSSMLQPMKQL